MKQQSALQPQPSAQIRRPQVAGGVLQRTCACGGTPGPAGECEACRRKRLGVMQRSATGAHGPITIPPVVNEVLRSPGSPLDGATRAFMEPRFGHDFSQVRVHTDSQAAESARAVHAAAYTVGHRVVFDQARYAPGSREGRMLLAHELTHVIHQQDAGSDSAESIGPATGPFEADADRAAAAIDSGDPLRVAARGPLPAIQRQIRPGTPPSRSVAQWSRWERLLYAMGVGLLGAEGFWERLNIILAIMIAMGLFAAAAVALAPEIPIAGWLATLIADSAAALATTVGGASVGSWIMAILAAAGVTASIAIISNAQADLIRTAETAETTDDLDRAAAAWGDQVGPALADIVVAVGSQVRPMLQNILPSGRPPASPALRPRVQVPGPRAATPRPSPQPAPAPPRPAPAAEPPPAAPGPTTVPPGGAGSNVVPIGRAARARPNALRPGVRREASSLEEARARRLAQRQGTAPETAEPQPQVAAAEQPQELAQTGTGGHLPRQSPAASNRPVASAGEGGPSSPPAPAGPTGQPASAPASPASQATTAQPGAAPRAWMPRLTPVRPARTVNTPSGPVRDPGFEGRRADDPWIGIQRNVFRWTRANLSKMLRGEAPTGIDGRPVPLHHRAQQPSGPLDEYTATEHTALTRHLHGEDYSRIDRPEFAYQRARYWITRARRYLGIE